MRAACRIQDVSVLLLQTLAADLCNPLASTGCDRAEAVMTAWPLQCGFIKGSVCLVDVGFGSESSWQGSRVASAATFVGVYCAAVRAFRRGVRSVKMYAGDLESSLTRVPLPWLRAPGPPEWVRVRGRQSRRETCLCPGLASHARQAGVSPRCLGLSLAGARGGWFCLGGGQAASSGAAASVDGRCGGVVAGWARSIPSASCRAGGRLRRRVGGCWCVGAASTAAGVATGRGVLAAGERGCRARWWSLRRCRWTSPARRASSKRARAALFRDRRLGSGMRSSWRGRAG